MTKKMRKILVVAAFFYEDIYQKQIDALKAMRSDAEFEIILVPGALEIPQAIAIECAKSSFDGCVALGCVIRGETYHFEVVSNESASAIMRYAMDHEMPIGNGIITCENYEQAVERAEKTAQNALKACFRLIELKLEGK